MPVIITDRERAPLRRVQLDCGTVSKVEKSHKDECNINTIMRKVARTGLMSRRSEQPKYGDFTSCNDFHDIQNRLIEADNDFMSLPSYLRNRFHNDVGELVDFLNNPENEQEAIELGLLPKPTAEVDSEESSVAGDSEASNTASETPVTEP